MRILLLTQYFWPENFIINDIVRTLGEQGHEVVVATGKPNYPDGSIFPGYAARGTQTEHYTDTIDVVRVPLWPRGRGGARNLAGNYLSFVLTGLIFFPWLLRGRRFDAIVVFAPSPITQTIPAILLKWIKRAPLVLWVQDLWPESLEATGFVKSRRILGAVGWMVRGIYRYCDLLLVQSRAFTDSVARYAAREKIEYYPNSIPKPKITPGVALPGELSKTLAEHFCVVFAGNLGTAQGLDTIVLAARQLRDYAGVRLVLVGSGSRLEWLKQQKDSQRLDNLILTGRLPPASMPALFRGASALLVALNDEPIFAQTIPSKLQAYMAASRPIVASLNGEGARVVEEAGAGLTSAAGDATALAGNIVALHSMTNEQREAFGQAGYQYYLEHFEMESQCRRLVEILFSLTEQHRK